MHHRQYSLEEYNKSCVMFRKYFAKFLPESREAKILDIGCGAGEFVYFLQQEGYNKVHGVDISPEMIKIAKAMGVKNVMIVKDVIAYLKGHLLTYDLITLHDVIEHLSKKDSIVLLKMINQGLKRGGRLFVSTPNGASPFGMRAFSDDFTHEIVFTPRSLSDVLNLCDFSNITIREKGPYVHGLKSATRWGLWRLIRTGIRFYQLVETGKHESGIYTEAMFAVAEKE